MKIFHHTRSLVLAVGVAFALSTVAAHADDKKPAKRHRSAKAKTEKVQKEELAGQRTTLSKAPSGRKIPTSDGRNSVEAEGRLVGGANGSEYRTPTGSNIPRKYNRRGYTTDDDRNMFIFDENDQRLQSHATTEGALRSVPGLSVRGPGGL